MVEALDEGRELVVPLENRAVREVALLDLGEPDRETSRRARDPIDENAGEERGPREDDDGRDSERAHDGEDDAAQLETLGPGDPEVPEESPRLALERRPDEDEDGPALERPAGLPVEDGLGQEQRERGPARGPRARARGRRRRLAGRRLLAAGVRRARDARRLALLAGVERDVDAALVSRRRAPSSP